MPHFELNGLKLYYEDLNPNADKTVVFLNGVMASVRSWDNQVPVFEKLGYRIILQDFKGQALSDKPKGPYSFEEHASETKALLDYLNVKNPHLIGTSYGGEVAMVFAKMFPDFVKSISIIDSVSELDELLRQSINTWKLAAKSQDGETFYTCMAPTIYGNSYLEKNLGFLEERKKQLNSVSKDYYEGQITLYDTFLNLNITSMLPDIKCPALVVCGEDDTLKPRKFSALIAKEIPNSEFAIIPDCGHITIFEKADVLNSFLLGFITKNL